MKLAAMLEKVRLYLGEDWEKTYAELYRDREEEEALAATLLLAERLGSA